MLYLASQSPRRREILDQVGVSYRVIPQNIDETPLPQESPESYVQRLALEKARAGLASVTDKTDNDCALGADTIVVLEGQILGKPKDRQSGCEMLAALSGRKHLVMSAIAIVDKKQSCNGLSMTEVFFGSLDQQLIDKYWDTEEPCDKAGGYGIQGFGAFFVEKIIGSYSGVVGLPIEILFPMLERLKIPYWNSQ
ncbi:MAG: Maf family nucleotide pyrophosphatase [Cellvibrionaceae bacterium]